MSVPATAQRPRSPAYGWMIRLAMLLPNNLTESEAADRCRVFAEELETDFPPAAFSRDSLHHVASEARYWPSYADLKTWLSAWWRDHRPPVQALPAPSTEIPSEQRCTPAQAAEILTEYGWQRTSTGAWVIRNTTSQTVAVRPPNIPDVSLRGEALQQARQRAGYGLAHLANQAVQRAADGAGG